MKELLSKKFWQGVKKTFDEARAPGTSKQSGNARPATPAEVKPKDIEAPGIPTPETAHPEDGAL